LGGCGAEDMMIRFEDKIKMEKEMKEVIFEKKRIHFIVHYFELRHQAPERETSAKESIDSFWM
jgi:hypothetical protein